MSADPYPDGPVPDAVERLFAHHAMAMAAGDAEAVVDNLAFPHAVALRGHTSIFEDEDAAVEAYGRALADWRANGVHGVTGAVRAFQELPDHAGRASVMWRLTGADGTERLAFEANYTVIEDEGDWRIIGADVRREEDARDAAGWPARAGAETTGS